MCACLPARGHMGGKMPHINRIRVNNVKYNFGTQFYDDFMMRFSCKNTIYDLANGGGKSVLMLLLLQNLIPNSTLDDKQPVEKLFRTNEGSTTIHSLIEWKLSDAHVKDQFRYMLTGFCARKAKEKTGGEETDPKEESEETGAGNSQSIEYFNYCIFYRTFNDNDIKNLPLSKNGERITYTGLKNYLRGLEKTDRQLEVRIFERKGDYQRFIAGYGLYESEWEIIRGINKTEGHVRTYFETNYKTTRKVVEDLLIEEIIEKSFRNRYLEENTQDRLAKTLLDIKDQLMDLSKKKEEISHYDRQMEMLQSFIERTGSIRQLYIGMEDSFLRMKKLYNTLVKREQDFEGERRELLEQRETLLEDKKDLGRKAATAKVLVEQKKLLEAEKEFEEQKEQYEEINHKQQALLEELNFIEGANEYFAYREAKKDYEKQSLVIAGMMRDNGELLEKLKAAVAVRRLSDEENKNEIRRELLREKAKEKEEADSIAALTEKIAKDSNQIAVMEFELTQLKQELQKLNDAMLEEKNKVSILLPSEAVVEQGKLRVKLVKWKEQMSEWENRLQELKGKEVILRIDYEREQTKWEELERRKNVLQEKAKKLLNPSNKLERIREVYQEQDGKRLEKKIYQSYKNAVVRFYEEKQKEQQLQKQYTAICDNKPWAESKDVENVLAYLKRYHTKLAVSGAAYLGNLMEEDRLEVIRQNPVLANAVIVYENGDRIRQDFAMWQQVKTEGFVPIIDAQEMEGFHESLKNTALLHQDNIFCMVLPPDKFRDATLEKEKEALKQQITKQSQVLKQRAEHEEVMWADYAFVKMLNDELTADADGNPQKVLGKLEEDSKRILTKIELLKAEMESDRREQSGLSEQMEALKQQISEGRLKEAVFENIVQLLEEYKQCEKHKDQKERKLSAQRLAWSDETKRLEAVQQMHAVREERIRYRQNELEEIDRIWKEKYQNYYDEVVYHRIAQDYKGKTVREIKQILVGQEDLEVTLEALLAGLVNENASVADKEQLLNHYQAVMERSLGRLDYLGFTKETMETLYEKKELRSTPLYQIAEKRRLSEEYRQEKNHARTLMEQRKTVKDRLQGQVSHAISVIEKEYGAFEQTLVGSEETDTFLHETDNLLNRLNERLTAVAKAIKELEEGEVMISLLKKNCERSMERSGFKGDSNAGFYGETKAKQLEEEYNRTAEGLDRFISDRYKRSEEFEKELTMLTETLQKSGAERLAMELRENVTMPVGMEAVDQLVTALTEIVHLIALEKDRIEKGITDIQLIKENFENQCIQSCVNMKTELERLPRLSKITIDEENISMLQLKIPYVSEELYKDRMSEYIDKIADHADTIESETERLKYIRNNLSWKKMFAVIVTDMNAIRLNLYKRERMAGQSRYLPYEEAVGSTGQSQGIYIQFLISIINYISSINAKDTMASGLRKVLFIDNPFGAAKDIYIWEPIFKLLKTNNVQLIVPARGATPAITGRFDVNYVLGQKMCGGRQQTVVVDYHSDVVTDELEYTTLEYEQTTLF